MNTLTRTRSQDRFIHAWEPAGRAEALDEAAPLYPMTLAEGQMHEALTQLYWRWAQRQQWLPKRGETPWVPVGCCGPVLILGHYCPPENPAPLPQWCFQAVRLSVEDYQRRLEELFILHEQTLVVQEQWSEGIVFPELYVRPRGRRAALQFLLEHYPNADTAEAALRRRLSSTEPEPCNALSDSYEAAVEMLLRRAILVDLRSVKSPELPAGPLEKALPASCTLVAHSVNCVWVASSLDKAAPLEDQLLNELGDGWRVQVLRAGHLETASGEAQGGTTPGAGRQRERIVIEGRAARLPAGERGAITPGEIHISERLASELEYYDPRRPGRDPAKVFLKELNEAIRCGASDLHIEPGVEVARVRVRVDGVMEEWLEMSAEFGQAVVGAAKEMAGLPAERYMPQDGSCTIYHCGTAVGARVSSYPIRRSRQKLVMRLLPRRGSVPTLDELLPSWQAGMMRRAAGRSQGLVLVCGPTGSGKTTTLFSVLSWLNNPSRNIMTMEDPVEYELEGLNQAEIDPHRGVSWEVLLKGFLRQDPDAGLIGEVRDRETAEIALRQALTGHLVFATLHTISCARTLERLVDMGVNTDMLASALSLVQSQRLVRRLCRRCRVSRKLAAAEDLLFKRERVLAPETLWEANPAGCSHCRRGFSGRAAAVEVLPVVDEVARLIETGARAREFEEWMQRERLPNVFQAALQLASEGVTSLEEALEWQSVWGTFDWRPHA